MISENARIRILTLRVRWSTVGQIWSQIEKLIFLEIWDVPWRISMATIRRGTFSHAFNDLTTIKAGDSLPVKSRTCHEDW